MKHRLVILAAVLCCAAMLCACAAEPENTTPTQAPTTAPTMEPAGMDDPLQTDDGGSASNPGNGAMNIPSFMEGTQISATDVPELVTALQEVHEGATITRITHATYQQQQTYCIEYTLQDGTIQVAYVSADGSIVADGLSTPLDGSGSGSGSGGSGSGGSGSGSTGGTGGDNGNGSGASAGGSGNGGTGSAA